MVDPENDTSDPTKKLSMSERQTWTSDDERQYVRSLVERNEWLNILGGYNALMTFDFQWSKMAEQANEDARAFKETYFNNWTNAAIFAVKSCDLATIPKEWQEAWKLLSSGNPNRSAGVNLH